jgi:hypothetical protein
MLTGQNSFAIAESVNKKEVMQTLVNATKALKKSFNPQEKSAYLLTKIFVRGNQNFNIQFKKSISFRHNLIWFYN